MDINRILTYVFLFSLYCIISYTEGDLNSASWSAWAFVLILSFLCISIILSHVDSVSFAKIKRNICTENIWGEHVKIKLELLVSFKKRTVVRVDITPESGSPAKEDKYHKWWTARFW